MSLLSTLVKTVCLTIALGAPTAAFSIETAPSTTPPPIASPEAPVAPQCTTIEQVFALVAQSVPDSEIVEISTEPPYYIIFSSPSIPMDGKFNFDEKGCLTSVEDVAKVKA